MRSSTLLVRLACAVFSFAALAAAQTTQAPLSTPDEMKQIACFTACEDQIETTITSTCGVAAGDGPGTIGCLCSNTDAIRAMNSCLAQLCPEQQAGFPNMYRTLCNLASAGTSQVAAQTAAQCAQTCRTQIGPQITSTCAGGSTGIRSALVDRCTCDSPPLRAAFDSCVTQTCPDAATAASLVAVAACNALPRADPIAEASPTAEVSTDAGPNSTGSPASPTDGTSEPGNPPANDPPVRDADNASGRGFQLSLMSWALAAVVAAAMS